jgi:serine/threonine-protein kinase
LAILSEVTETERANGGDEDAPTRIEPAPIAQPPASTRKHDPDASTLPRIEAGDAARAFESQPPTGMVIVDDAPTSITSEPASGASEGSATSGGTGPTSGISAPTLGATMEGLRATRGTIASPFAAMRTEEVRRTRAFALVSMPFSVVVLAVLPLLGGDATAKYVVAAAMVLITAGAAALLYSLRKESGYSLRNTLAFGILAVLGGYSGIYYFGIFSPAVAIIPFGLYFFSVGQSLAGTLIIYVLCAVIQGALGGAVATGLLADRGLVRADDLAVVARLVIVLLVETTFLATFWIARASRKAMLHAISEHDRAVRAIVQREELLKEAKQDLERALEVGGLGRFTDEIVGSFRLGSILGRGGMGEVYEALHTTTGEPVAVKLLHGHALGDPEHVRRFLREARIASQLDAENIVRVIEVGGIEARVPFIAMERLRGEDLAEILRRTRRLAMPRVVAMAKDIARGLEAARVAGVVHRDLKPRNLFLAELGDRRVWKILDFGVSRLIADQATLTGAQVLGTPSFMAPEQIKTAKVDHRADVYALGVVCYRALTGRPAFVGDAMAEILFKVVHDMPSRPSVSARIPEDVDDVLALALAKSPDDRFSTALELADALDAAMSGTLSRELRERASQVLATTPWKAT